MPRKAARRWRIQLYVPEMPSADELAPYLHAIDRSRRYTNFGANVAALEREIITFLNAHELNFRGAVGDAVTAASGTAALTIALQALGLSRGAAVLLPAYTFVATATAVVAAGLTPVIADIDRADWRLSPERAAAIQRRMAIEAVVPVAPYGLPLDVDAWSRYEADTRTPVIIDAAAAFGNQRVDGTTATIFSLHATKILPAAEGGLICSRDAELVRRSRLMTNFGLDGVHLAAVGTNAKLSEYHAAIARCQLAKLPDIIDRRKRLARRYLEIFDGIDPRLHLVDPGAYIPSVMPLVAPNGALRDRVEAALHANGVETRRGYYPTLDRQQVLDGIALRADTGETAFANSSWWQDHLLCLPFHPELTERDIRTIREYIHSAVHL